MRKLIGSFADYPGVARQGLAELLASDPPSFRVAALAAMRDLGDRLCRQCLLELMLRARLLPACDPALLTLEEETAMVRDLIELDPSLDMKLAQRLSTASAEAGTDQAAQRILSLLAVVPENPRVLPLVIKLLRHPSPELRSKAALVIGRLSRTPEMARQLLSEPDPRVRANAIEALWGVDSPKARMVLRQAAEDPNNRVVGNALLGLYRLGDPAAIAPILRLAAHPEPLFRATAAWIMEQTGSPRFLPTLGQMVRETAPKTRTCVFHAIARLKPTSSASGQARLRVHLLGANGHPDGSLTASAVIASENGREIPSLLATDVVLWEDSRIVADYSVRSAPTPSSVALALALPEGEVGDRTLSALSPLKRDQDRWSVVRYLDEAAAASLDQAFAFLLGSPVDRHMIFVVPSGGDPAQWAPIGTRARAGSIFLHSIPYGAGDSDELAAACERVYLNLLCAYELAWRNGEKTPSPAEVKLEVYTEQGYGVDIWKLSSPGMRSAA
jgi:hypothetical protein